jgi:peroxiredoxin
MLRRLLAVLCLLALSSAYAKTPRPLVDVPIQTPDRKNFLLKKYRGQVVVLVIFSTTCEDCVAILNFMNKLQQDYGARGLQVVAAAGDDNARFTLGPFIQRYRPTFPVGYMDKASIIRIADVPKDARPVAPIVLFIDRLGLVRFQYYGNDPFMKEPDKNFRAIATGLINSSERRVVPAPAPKPQ